MALDQLLKKTFLWQALWRRTRRCLLKGCETAFAPIHPLSRYCSDACRKAARHWSRWWAAKRYRATDGGKAQRAQQAQRRRNRQRRTPQSSRASPSHPTGNKTSATGSNTSPSTSAWEACVARLAFLAGGVGHHDHDTGKINCCHRPGCYQRFAVPKRSPFQRFCDAFCRQALRRVKERERRLRKNTGS